MAVNYVDPVRLTMGLLPAMRAQRFGHVVNIVTWGVQVKAPKLAAYAERRAATPERAAARVVRALEDRQVTVNGFAGSVGEVLNLVAPRLADHLFWRFDRAYRTRRPRGLPLLRGRTHHAEQDAGGVAQEREPAVRRVLGGLHHGRARSRRLLHDSVRVGDLDVELPA